MNQDLMVFILEIIKPKTIKNGAYVINLDEYADTGTHWIALYVKNNEVIYFDSLGVEHLPKEIQKFMGQKHQNKRWFKTSEWLVNGL